MHFIKTNIYFFKSLRANILTFYIKIKPINYLFIPLGLTQVAFYLLAIIIIRSIYSPMRFPYKSMQTACYYKENPPVPI